MPPNDYPAQHRDTIGLFFRVVERAMDDMQITDPIFRCMLLAMIEQECIGQRGPSNLAMEYKNLFGFKRIKGLPTVTLPANEFEDAPQSYAVFPTFERCLQSGLYAIFTSSHYERARFAAKLTFIRGFKDGKRSMHQLKMKWCETWLMTAAKTWCPVNPAHGPQVTHKFHQWVSEYMEGGRIR